MTSTYHIGLFLLRVGFSGYMLAHGIPKLLEVLQGDFSFGDPIGLGEPVTKILAVLGEVIAPLLIIIGYKTRISAVIAAITMCVAAFVVHAQDPFSSKEKALMYGTAFIVIALTGAGRYSVDRK